MFGLEDFLQISDLDSGHGSGFGFAETLQDVSTGLMLCLHWVGTMIIDKTDMKGADAE
jgi:hypothetical protein